jgi:hypothetical protein
MANAQDLEWFQKTTALLVDIADITIRQSKFEIALGDYFDEKGDNRLDLSDC